MGDADPDEEDAPPRSAAARLAGVLRAGHGLLALAAGVLACSDGYGACCTATAGGYGVVFPTVGLRTATGRAADTLWFAVGSVGLAVLALVAAKILFDLGDRSGAAVVGGFGGSLSVPGVLAIAGRRDHRAWRARRLPRPPE